MIDSWVERVLRATGGAAAHGLCLRLFAGPYLSLDGRHCPIPEGSQRLVVFVALRRGRVDRRTVAGVLWPDSDDERAAGNLRSALWRCKRAGVDVVRSDKQSLWIEETMSIDVDLVALWAARLIAGEASAEDLGITCTGAESGELLPGWYDDWVLLERERARQRQLHAMEALSRRLLADGRTVEALDVALGVVAAEPLRESAQRVLLAVHVAEGNWGEARRSFAAYQRLLEVELGILADEVTFDELVQGHPTSPPRPLVANSPGRPVPPIVRRPVGTRLVPV